MRGHGCTKPWRVVNDKGNGNEGTPMQRDTAQRVKQIFGEALEKPADQRAAFVADACDGDEELQEKVEALLAAYDDAGEFMSAPTDAGLGRAGVDAEA